MSTDAERLRDLDTEVHKDRAWSFWLMSWALTVAMTFAFPPTHGVGATAGWVIVGVFLGTTLAYVVRLVVTQGDVGPREVVISTLTPIGTVAIGQWLAGGVHAYPLELLFTLHVFGGAALLKGRVRALHLGLVLAVVMAPIAYSHVTTPLAVASICYALVLALQAGFLLDYGRRLREHRLALFEAERDASARAVTDALTGLGNRRALELALEGAAARAAGGEPLTIVYLDLDGFKAYNDRFGHGAGDALLQRLGGALHACVQGRGRAFRLGGDEFCALLDGELDLGDALLQRIHIALSEQGSGFRIGPSCGVVSMPRDVREVSAALRLADERMYTAKRSGRPSPAQEISQVLVRVMSEHEPASGSRALDLGALARGTALRLGLEPAEADTVARAAELHDIGKVAIPDAVLTKPGPLDREEWELVRQHPVIGERILAASPSFAQVAALVRSSHERIDGAGYPDRLRGEEIPLGARIVAVCDAYAAMLSDRPYRRALGRAGAEAELLAGCGRQFDAEVVEALLEELAGSSVRPAAHGEDAAARVHEPVARGDEPAVVA